jgi:hypothetical protein
MNDSSAEVVRGDANSDFSRFALQFLPPPSPSFLFPVFANEFSMIGNYRYKCLPVLCCESHWCCRYNCCCDIDMYIVHIEIVVVDVVDVDVVHIDVVHIDAVNIVVDINVVLVIDICFKLHTDYFFPDSVAYLHT